MECSCFYTRYTQAYDVTMTHITCFLSTNHKPLYRACPDMFRPMTRRTYHPMYIDQSESSVLYMSRHAQSNDVTMTHKQMSFMNAFSLTYSASRRQIPFSVILPTRRTYHPLSVDQSEASVLYMSRHAQANDVTMTGNHGQKTLCDYL
jgi:hypothetical protein